MTLKLTLMYLRLLVKLVLVGGITLFRKKVLLIYTEVNKFTKIERKLFKIVIDIIIKLI